MKNMRYAGLAWVLSAMFLCGLAGGYQLPAVNLGFTSFLDGAPPSGPGWYLTQYVQFFSSDQFVDNRGSEISFAGRKADVDAWISLTQLIYQSDQEVFLGGKWGLDLIIPFVDFNLSPSNLPISENDSGFGDLLVGPYLQWDPVQFENGMVFMHRVELQMIFPTGDYDSDNALNPGSNHFSLNPYWAATLIPAPRWSTSVRLHYLWNDENEDPAAPLDSIQAGQAFHMNFAAAYEVVPQRMRVGINGYYLEQFENSQFNGRHMSDTRERILGIGPGTVFHITPDLHLFFNLYWESMGQNRPEGCRGNLRLVYHF